MAFGDVSLCQCALIQFRVKQNMLAAKIIDWLCV